MGQEGAQKRGTSTLPTSTAVNARNSRSCRQINKRVHNIKMTVFCGLITYLVLRGTIGFGEFPSIPEDGEITIILNYNYSLGAKISNWDEQRSLWLSKNQGFPNVVNGKARILLVTGSSPKPCDNPVGDHYLLKSLKNKIDYCRIHGIEIVYNMAPLQVELSGYWAKLPLIRMLMLSHPEVEWIWWMDSDALITDMVFELPLWKYKDHNMVIQGYLDMLLKEKPWLNVNTGDFLLRNCQWSLDLLDAWALMGLQWPVREEAGKILTTNLKGPPAFEADDQSALVYMLITQTEWMEKVFLEDKYLLHGYWEGLVDRYEEMMEKYHPGFGDDRWPFVTHFVGCKPCASYAHYPVHKCVGSMERAFNFADNQVLKLYGLRHKGLLSPNIKRFIYETTTPLEYVDQFDIRHAAQLNTTYELS